MIHLYCSQRFKEWILTPNNTKQNLGRGKNEEKLSLPSLFSPRSFNFAFFQSQATPGLCVIWKMTREGKKNQDQQMYLRQHGDSRGCSSCPWGCEVPSELSPWSYSGRDLSTSFYPYFVRDPHPHYVSFPAERAWGGPPLLWLVACSWNQGRKGHQRNLSLHYLKFHRGEIVRSFWVFSTIFF